MNDPTKEPSLWRADARNLLCLTAIGAALRFAILSRPCLWNDEAMTYCRVAGSFREMLEILKDSGFVPLHYVLLWVLGRCVGLSPVTLRLIPAIAGTLMIPAVYVLARQIAGRRTALWSAAFATVSAFMLAYSRDSKMYMPFWLAATCTIAAFLAWCRTGGWKGWAVWVLAALAMTGLHAQAVIVLLLLPLFYAVLGPRRVASAAAAIAGAGIPLLCLGAYYFAVSHWVQNIETNGWGASGLDWVARRTAGRRGSALALDTVASFLFGWSWIDEPGGRGRIDPRLALAATVLTATWVGAAAAGSLRLLWFSGSHREVGLPDRWRRWLVTGVWVVLPTYTVYAMTVPEVRSPMYLLRVPFLFPWHSLATALGAVAMLRFARMRPALAADAARILPWLACVIAAGWTWNVMTTDTPGLSRMVFPRVCIALPACCMAALVPAAAAGLRRGQSNDAGTESVRPWLIVGVLASLCLVVYAAIRLRPGTPVWLPRYLGVIWPAMAIGLFAALGRLPSRLMRAALIGLLFAVNLAQATARLSAGSEPPLDRVADDVIRAQDPAGPLRVYTQHAWHRWGPPGTGTVKDFVGKAYLFMRSGRHVAPVAFRDRPAKDFFLLRMETAPAAIRQDLDAAPDVREIIVWQRVGSETDGPDDPFLDALGHQWMKTSEKRFAVRVFWNWGHLYTFARRAYSRAGGSPNAR